MSAPNTTAAAVKKPGGPASSETGDISTRTKQKADASKSFLEQHYMGMLRSTSSGQPARPINQPRLKDVGPSDFETLKLIGRGAYGEVHICKMVDDQAVDPKLYAIKRMSKVEMLKKRKVFHVRSENNVLAEAVRGSPWIVDLHYSFQDEKFLYMVMDYMPGGDLMTWLCNEGVFSVEATKFYIAELCMAVQTVHEKEYVHRDIKPDNVLMDRFGHTKLSDFGLCKAFPKEGHIVDLYAAVEHEQQLGQRNASQAGFSTSEPLGGEPVGSNGTAEAGADLAKASGGGDGSGSTDVSPQQRRVQFLSIVGSPGYIAPEILMRQPYTTGCDWWSVGVIMYEMLYGRTPFYSHDPQKTGYMITHWAEFLKFPAGRGVPDDAVDLLRRLLCGQEDRITFNDIKGHPFFGPIDWDTLHEAPPVFVPNLTDPLDVKYFPPHEELVRAAPRVDHAAGTELQSEDPRGVLFADFRFDKRRAQTRSASSKSE